MPKSYPALQLPAAEYIFITFGTMTGKLNFPSQIPL